MVQPEIRDSLDRRRVIQFHWNSLRNRGRANKIDEIYTDTFEKTSAFVKACVFCVTQRPSPADLRQHFKKVGEKIFSPTERAYPPDPSQAFLMLKRI